MCACERARPNAAQRAVLRGAPRGRTRVRAARRARAQGRARERAQARWIPGALVWKEGKKGGVDVSCSVLANTVGSWGTQRTHVPPYFASAVLQIARSPDTEALMALVTAYT
jgi:hypothetical protein